MRHADLIESALATIREEIVEEIAWLCREDRARIADEVAAAAAPVLANLAEAVEAAEYERHEGGAIRALWKACEAFTPAGGKRPSLPAPTWGLSGNIRTLPPEPKGNK